MSQPKARTYINIASFKLNRISLLNQSQFNPSLNNMFVNKIINKNIFQSENIEKINPLANKNKIIKKHNILKKIDFNANISKTNLLKKNNSKSNEFSLINNKTTSPRIIFQNKKIHLPILMYNN